jgi:hypothetical protein
MEELMRPLLSGNAGINLWVDSTIPDEPYVPKQINRPGIGEQEHLEAGTCVFL